MAQPRDATEDNRMAQAKEHVIHLHITATPEKAEGVMDVIAWMLTSPNPEDSSPRGFGMPGVTFEGMTMEELDEDGNPIPSDPADG